MGSSFAHCISNDEESEVYMSLSLFDIMFIYSLCRKRHVEKDKNSSNGLDFTLSDLEFTGNCSSNTIFQVICILPI